MEKINEFLAKILDMKTEVVKIAATARQVRVAMIELQSKFSSSVSGLHEANKDITQEIIWDTTLVEADIQDLTTLRNNRRYAEVLTESPPRQDAATLGTRCPVPRVAASRELLKWPQINKKKSYLRDHPKVPP